MRRFRIVPMTLALVALVAALSVLMAGPVNADDIACAGGDIPSTDGNVTVTGFCTLPAGSTVNGNIFVTGAALVLVQGVVNGNIEANATFLLGSSPVRVDDGGSVHGNVISEGIGGITVNNGSVAGNLEQKGTGPIVVQAIGGGTAAVNGNLIHEGTGLILIRVFGGADGGGTVTIDGNVEAKSGGANTAAHLDGPLPPGSSITIDGSVCGGPPVGYGGPIVTVNGSINASC